MTVIIKKSEFVRVGFVGYYCKEFYTYFNLKRLRKRSWIESKLRTEMKRRHKLSESCNDNGILQECVLQWALIKLTKLLRIHLTWRRSRNATEESQETFIWNSNNLDSFSFDQSIEYRWVLVLLHSSGSSMCDERRPPTR